jgi:hypothetical protein
LNPIRRSTDAAVVAVEAADFVAVVAVSAVEAAD